eukprot:m.58324 g.58324  ORF g.58324 m.58324 type:complete len:58 (+) comp11680_c0_seq1:231-404(+)
MQQCKATSMGQASELCYWESPAVAADSLHAFFASGSEGLSGRTPTDQVYPKGSLSAP